MPTLNSARVLIVGAGLTGLTVAARLLAAGREVLVLESSSRCGGQIETYREPGLVVELGAEGFVARSRALPALCELLGSERSLVEQLTTDTYVLAEQQLVLLPPGEAARRLGFQVPEQELGRGIRSLAGGMGELIDALLARVGNQRVRLATPVTAIRGSVGALELELGPTQRETGGVVVLATPARKAAELLTPLALPSAAAMSTAPVMSNVSVNLLYRRAALALVPPGSGLLFPERFAGVGLRALSLSSHKFAGRAPADSVLLRVFFRPSATVLAPGGWDDARFASEARRAVAEVLGASAEPERSWVSRWVELLPVLSAAHREQVGELDAALQARGIHLAGSAFHGAGIDAAVVSAEAIAARLAG
ncbi:MAG TPA: FAD-dependent oxidoreductase [Polyangiaceae bacterium]